MTNRTDRSFALWCGSMAGLAALLLTTPSTGSGAPAPDKPCTLLTDAEITAAVGAPGKSHEGQMPVTQGPAKGETMRTCSWAVGTGAVNLSLVKVGDVESAKSAFHAQMHQTMQALKTQGWTIEEKAFRGDVDCWIGTPPAGHSEMPRATGCAGAAHGMGVCVSATGSSKVQMEGVNKLLDAAMKRAG